MNINKAIMATLKSIVAKDKNIAESPAVDEFLEKELSKMLKSSKMKELAERIALQKNTSADEALRAIMDKLGSKAGEMVNKKKAAAWLES